MGHRNHPIVCRFLYCEHCTTLLPTYPILRAAPEAAIATRVAREDIFRGCTLVDSPLAVSRNKRETEMRKGVGEDDGANDKGISWQTRVSLPYPSCRFYSYFTPSPVPASFRGTMRGT